MRTLDSIAFGLLVTACGTGESPGKALAERTPAPRLRVVHEDGGEPVEGAQVYVLYDWDAFDPEQSYLDLLLTHGEQGLTDARGEVSLRDAEPLLAIARRDGWTSMIPVIADELDRHTPFEFDALGDRVLELFPCDPVDVLVVRADGAPASGVPLWLDDATSHGRWPADDELFTAVTDARGRAHFPFGGVNPRLNRTGTDLGWGRGRLRTNLPLRTTTWSAGESGEVRVQLPPASALEVRWLGAAGAGWVELEFGNGPFVPISQRTRPAIGRATAPLEDGVARFPFVEPEREATVRVQLRDGRASPDLAASTAPAGERRLVEAAPRPSLPVVGWLHGPDGQPLPDAELFIVGSGVGRGSRVCTTGARGAFEFHLGAAERARRQFLEFWVGGAVASIADVAPPSEGALDVGVIRLAAREQRAVRPPEPDALDDELDSLDDF